MLKLQVTVGSSYDPSTHIIFLPNDDENPFFIDTEYFTGRICVRVRDFKGVPPPEKKLLSSSPYFNGNNYQYSIQIQGRFKGNKWTADDILFGNDFDRKINLPTISWLGLKILKWIDPALEADIYSEKPWAYSPLLFTTNSARVQDSNDSNDLPPWPSPNGEHLKDDTIYDPIIGSLISTDETSLEVNDEMNKMNFIEDNEKLIPEEIKMEKNAISTPTSVKFQQQCQGTLTPNSVARWASVKSPSSKNHLTPYRRLVVSQFESNASSSDESASDDEFDFEQSSVD
ncbi:12803_t:CDS:2 [Racocetra fulgida]|uniref:12803_t:CDS:1 n=1 Tax=Racocetra fulgida TaxID=60492 RepID=A0A9N9FCU3_9GLOM|nr:12803_t:CDS:2 [Racocetra fulgida]